MSFKREARLLEPILELRSIRIRKEKKKKEKKCPAKLVAVKVVIARVCKLRLFLSSCDATISRLTELEVAYFFFFSTKVAKRCLKMVERFRPTALYRINSFL